MKRETIVAAISFTCFGILIGWILGAEQAPPPPASPAPVAAAAAGPSEAPPPPLDTAHAADLEKQAASRPRDAAVRVELGNVYYDAHRFDLAAPWYEASLAIDPRNVMASTDLAVCYYNTSQVDKALAQIDHSLSIDPRHGATLLNQGIIRGMGKGDLAGAIESWQKAVAAAPNTEAARQAQEFLDSVKGAHPGSGAAAAGSGRSGGGVTP